MNQIKLVHGAGPNRKFRTPAKEAELKRLDEQSKKVCADRFAKDCFTVDEDEEFTFSDVLMTLGMFVVMPFLGFVTAIGVIFV